jgi:hypothetical protein
VRKDFCGDGRAWAVAAAPRGAAVARRSVTYIDLTAREKWFFQAQVESPAMFRRTAGAGSLYWLGTRDASGAYLDGGNAYRLRVPQPVSGKLFWSVTSTARKRVPKSIRVRVMQRCGRSSN